MNIEKIDSVVETIFGEEGSIASVNHIFSVFAVAYPSFARTVGAAEEKDILAFWAYHISDFTHSKEARRAIVWALQNLPATRTAPNAMEFKMLCRQAPAAAVPQLPAPAVNPEIAKKVLGGLKASPAMRHDEKGWARRIVADIEAGAKRTPTVARMAYSALGMAV